MDLIIKPTELCNFKCTFCSSTNITDDKSLQLPLETIYQFLERFPSTRTIIVNGGDPLMVKPEYYQALIDWLDAREYSTVIAFTTNLWAFHIKPEKWLPVFRNKRVVISTSFQYEGGRLKGDLSPYTESDFWKVSDQMLELVGYRPGFISVVTPDTIDPIRNVELAKEMDVCCKLNPAVSSGTPIMFKGIRMGQRGNPLLTARMYEIYVEIAKRGLARWEYNTQQIVQSFHGEATTCPIARKCDAGIRVLQPAGDYYTCGSFSDDREYAVDFQKEVIEKGEVQIPLQKDFKLLSMHQGCFTCKLFDFCNGCRKNIADMKDNNLVEQHCARMKAIEQPLLEMRHLSI